jgi:hypothetical protein
MLRSLNQLTVGLITSALILSACAMSENEAETAERLDQLPAPARAESLLTGLPSVDEQLPVRDLAARPPYGSFSSDCGEIEEYVGEPLFYLAMRPSGFRSPRCWLSLSIDESDHWAAGVLYLPESARPESQSLLSVIEGGAVDIIMTFNLRRASPQPGDPDYSHTLSPSTARVTVRGREGVIQRMGEKEARIAWIEPIGALGNVEIVIEAGMDPVRLFLEAQNLTRFPS